MTPTEDQKCELNSDQRTS